MPRQVYLFDRPARFVTGTVGQPGDRTFFLQASDGARVVSVSLEKAQVAVLADRMDELLGEVVQAAPAVPSVVPLTSPADEVAAVDDTDPLDTPVEEEFRVGAMGLAWDSDEQTVVVEAVAAGEEPVGEDTILSDTEDGPDALRVRITPASARAFIARARRVIAAGRPPCPLCALPLDPGGHVCPRQNGYRR
ncbi:DUF3090 domain-containing protein [soil metagenome]